MATEIRVQGHPPPDILFLPQAISCILTSQFKITACTIFTYKILSCFCRIFNSYSISGYYLWIDNLNLTRWEFHTTYRVSFCSFQRKIIIFLFYFQVFFTTSKKTERICIFSKNCDKYIVHSNRHHFLYILQLKSYFLYLCMYACLQTKAIPFFFYRYIYFTYMYILNILISSCFCTQIRQIRQHSWI